MKNDQPRQSASVPSTPTGSPRPQPAPPQKGRYTSVPVFILGTFAGSCRVRIIETKGAFIINRPAGYRRGPGEFNVTHFYTGNKVAHHVSLTTARRIMSAIAAVPGNWVFMTRETCPKALAKRACAVLREFDIKARPVCPAKAEGREP